MKDEYRVCLYKGSLLNLFTRIESEANKERDKNKEGKIKADKIQIKFNSDEIIFIDELPDDIFHLSPEQREELKSGKAICYLPPARQITVLVSSLSANELKEFETINNIAKKVEWMDAVIFDLYLQWNTFKRIFTIESDKKQNPWFDIHPQWFLLAIRSALIDSIFVSLCKITRPSYYDKKYGIRKKGSKNNVLKSLIDEITFNTKEQSSLILRCEDLENKIDKSSPGTDASSIRFHRNKKIAHLDNDLISGKTALIGIPFKEIKEIILNLTALFKDVSAILTTYTFSYETAYVSDGIDNMSELIRLGFLCRSYKDYLRDMSCNIDKNTSIFNPVILESVEKNEHAKWIKDYQNGLKTPLINDTTY